MFSRVTTSTTLFPVYLVPPNPFRRVKKLAKSNHSTVSHDLTTDTFLSGDTSHLQCGKCQADICFTSQIISKGFTGRHGRAYLVSPTPTVEASPIAPGPTTTCLPNTSTDVSSQRQLVTGVHTVSDVRCALCGSMLGWKYDGAEEESQRYKVGKYILETKMVCSSSDWDHDDVVTSSSSLRFKYPNDRRTDTGNIEFDSQDEDECEDLFAGVWSPSLALKRRQNKSFKKAVLDMDARAR